MTEQEKVVAQIKKLADALIRIGDLPLEFNTRARAIAQEAMNNAAADFLIGSVSWREPITPAQFQKILYRESTHKPAPAEKIKEMEKIAMDGRNPEYFERSEETTERDPLTDEVLKEITENGELSISSIQRRFRIGYNRAARIFEQTKEGKAEQTPAENPQGDAQDRPGTTNGLPAYQPPAIEMIPVESGNVESVGHDGDKILRIKFKGSGLTAYDYPGIEPEAFFGLINADSVGKAYRATVAGVKGIKIELPE